MQDAQNLKDDFNLAKTRLEDLARASDNFTQEQLAALIYLEGIFKELSSSLDVEATDAEWEGVRPQLTKFFTKLVNEAKILTPP